MSIPTTIQIQAALIITDAIMSKAGFSTAQHSHLAHLAKKIYADVLQSVMEYGIPAYYKIT